MPVILQDSVQVIQRKIAAELFRQVKAKLISIQNPLREDIRLLLKSYIEAEDPYGSLKFGTLKAHFGLPSNRSSSMVDNIVEEAVSTVNLVENLKIGAKSISGGFSITAINSSYSDLFSLGDSIVITEKGTTLQWLEWLLVLGDAGIVTGYDVSPIKGKGRSGLAIMIMRPENVWSVPNNSDTGERRSFRGFPGNNWFTRAIDKMVDSGDLERIIITRLKEI